jgi:PAS domain S-box-containing protein
MDVVLSGRTVEQEVRARRRDGVYRWFLVRVVPLAPLGDDRGSAVVTAVDITDLKAANERSESAKNQLETVLRAIGDGVTARDRFGNVVYANEAAVRLMGFASPEELLGTPVTAVLGRFEIEDSSGKGVAEADLPGSRAELGEATDEELLRFRDIVTGEDRYSLVKAAPVFDAAGEVEYVVEAFRDVTDKVAADRERESLLRREREARLAAERAVARASALQQLTALLSRALTQREVAEVIVTKGVQATGAMAGFVAIREGDQAILIATHGEDEEFLARGRRLDLGEATPVSHTLLTGEELYIGLEEARQRFPELVASARSKSWATAPWPPSPLSACSLTVSMRRPIRVL